MTLRTIFAVLMIAGLAGIGTCDLLKRDWKTAILGLLFAAANVIIFLWK